MRNGQPCGYDPALGRFTQPDTIIPEQTQGTQAWDRYAYVNNNPVKYNDPSGHCVGPLVVVCFGVAAGLLTMAMDYGQKGKWTESAPNLGFGCLTSRCGGLADYFRDRGAVVWAVASVANTVTAGATTPGIVAGPTIASGQTAPLVSGALNVGVLNGVINVAQTGAQKGLLGEPIESEDLQNQFGIGLVAGSSTGLLDDVGLKNVYDVQRQNALEFIAQQKAVSNASAAPLSYLNPTMIPLPELPTVTPLSVNMTWLARALDIVSKAWSSSQ